MTDTPTIAWAKPNDRRVAWQAYVGDKIKIRELNDGTVQYATGESEWEDA